MLYLTSTQTEQIRYKTIEQNIHTKFTEYTLYLEQARTYRTVGVANRLELRSVTRDNAQLPCCDVTAGHYYSQLMTTAHPSCHWPAAARFIEHGQLGIVTGYRPKF